MTDSQACPSCGGAAATDATRARSRVVGGCTFHGVVTARVCSACDEVFFASSELERFDLQVATVISCSSEPSREGFKFMRRALGLKSKEAAQLLGVAPESVSRWENDARGCPKPEWRLLALLVQDQVSGRRLVYDHLASMAPRESGDVDVELVKVA